MIIYKQQLITKLQKNEDLKWETRAVSRTREI